MFEVVLTYRPDFTEKVLDRFATIAEAAMVAEQISQQHSDKVVRAWVRQVREARTKS